MRLCLILTFLCFQTFAECQVKDGYERCDVEVVARNLNGSKVPLFFYHSDNLNKNEQVHYVLFLHGRGYSRDMGAHDSMLDHLGLKHVFQEVGEQIIFVAPQDRYFHEDSQNKGQDYWLGIEGRDWQKFFTQELQTHIVGDAKKRGLTNFSLRTVMGISMGAHGALMLGKNAPDLFHHIGVISPVFRAVKEEMPATDYDVFLTHNEVDAQRNMGAAILKGDYSPVVKTVMTISFEDFAIDEEKFPVAIDVWDQLLEKQKTQKMLDVEISSLKGGHSMSFWRETVSKVLVKSHQ